MKTQTGVPNSPQAGLAGGAKLKNAGFVSPAKNGLFGAHFYLETCPSAKLSHFVGETYLCILGPSIQLGPKNLTFIHNFLLVQD